MLSLENLELFFNGVMIGESGGEVYVSNSDV